ncbi:MAG: wax ester/triacylglycerol synthase domain-containing protein, partial [Solirubrobacteraceae bacterium]
MPDHGHGERLSAIDASFLQLESASTHMHVGWCAMFSLSEGAAPPSIQALRNRIAARVAQLPRCRQ